MKTIGCTLTLSLLGFAATAFAQNQQHPTAGHITVSTDDQAATRAYWTAERMANAKPMPLPRVDPATAAANASPLQPVLPQESTPGGLPVVFTNAENVPWQAFEMLDHGEPPAGAVPQGFTYEMPFTNYQVPALNNYPYSTVGKLFFVIPPGASEPAGDYVCSGSVSYNGYTVLTARHCMFDYTTGIWYNSWAFDPAYSSGPNSKYGSSWAPRNLITWTSGASTSDYDIGLMQMYDQTGGGCNGSTGKTIGSYTGWLGTTWNGSYSQRQWDIFGYPQASPFGGNNMYQDEGATGALNPNGATNVIEVGNPQTGGTSGGPWVIGLNPKNANDPKPGNNTNPSNTNQANGVNSFQWTSPSQPLAINGPEFQTYNFSNLINSYKKISCP